MKGKITKIDDKKIRVTPCENFMDVEIERRKYDTTQMCPGQDAEITIKGDICITVNGERMYGELVYSEDE